ncbi:MAG: cytochrome B6, partial [Planctomycetota bacterium]
NPSVPENPAKAPWYFLGLQELVSYSAFTGGILIPGIVVVGLMLIPYLDRKQKLMGIWFSGPEGRRVAFRSAIFAAIFTVGVLAFTVHYGWLRQWYPEIPQLVITFINPGTVFVAGFALWSLRATRVRNSTRMGAISLFTCFAVSFVILTYFATVHRGPNWDFFWSEAAWPGAH